MPGKFRSSNTASKWTSTMPDSGRQAKGRIGAKSRKVTKTHAATGYKKATKPRMTQEADEMFRAKIARHPGASTTKKSVMFTLDAPSGLDVSIAGSFNDWEPQAMIKKRDGLWRAALQLAPGTHRYRFLVDTVWREDPSNPRKIHNDFGGFDSICDVL